MPILGIIASAITGNLVTTSYESIATVTVGGGGSARCYFSSIPATYTHLQIRSIASIADSPRNGATANAFGVGIIDILDYANTNKYKTIKSLDGCDLNGAGVIVYLVQVLGEIRQQ
jgi:hypothetical protein